MKQAYISTHLADAQSAGDRFHLTPIILLAQAALESGWGTSRLARGGEQPFRHHRLRGEQRLLARGAATARYKRGELLFRRYDSARELLPRLRPPPRLLLPAGRRHEPFPRRLRQAAIRLTAPTSAS